MDIFGKIKEKLSNEFIDIVEWLDYTDDTIAHRFERYQNEIKNLDIIINECTDQLLKEEWIKDCDRLNGLKDAKKKVSQYVK